MFEHSFLIERVKYFYTADPLRAKLGEVYGPNNDLDPDNLKCLLLIVTKNVTTDSPWPISSNPDAKYGSEQESEKGAILRCFAENKEFSLERRQSLRLQQQVVEILVSSPAA